MPVANEENTMEEVIDIITNLPYDNFIITLLLIIFHKTIL